MSGLLGKQVFGGSAVGKPQLSVMVSFWGFTLGIMRAYQVIHVMHTCILVGSY